MTSFFNSGKKANAAARAEAREQAADARRRTARSNTDRIREQQRSERASRGTRARLRGRGLTTADGMKAVLGG
jgi:hypothetical protein